MTLQPYKQIAHIPAGTARKDALRLTKKEKAKLPRVTAYCTATSYKLSDLQKFFNARRNSHHTDVKQFDDVLYTPYSYEPPRGTSLTAADTDPQVTAVGDLLGVPDIVLSSDTTLASVLDALPSPALEDPESGTIRPRRRVKRRTKFDKVGSDHPAATEVFIFEFGTVVCWGMTESQEKRFLSSMCASLCRGLCSGFLPIYI